MDFLKTTNSMTSEEKAIINEANYAMIKLKQWKKLEDNRAQIIANIERAIKLKFPGIESISISSDNIFVETKLHTNSVSRWTNDEDINIPSFKCNVQVKDLPDTAEEFMKMKKNIETDRQEIITVMDYIILRYTLEIED